MAFGRVVGVSGNNAGAITNPFACSASIAVSVGDLAVVVVAERITTAGTVGACSDNLVNSWNSLTGADGGTAVVTAYWSLITNAGSMTPQVAATASGADVTISCAVWEGPFDASPLDDNPACVIADTAPPLVGPTTAATLDQRDHLVVGYYGTSAGGTFSAPLSTDSSRVIRGIDRQDSSGTVTTTCASCLISCVGYQSTAGLTFTISHSSGALGAVVQGQAVFKRGAKADLDFGEPVYGSNGFTTGGATTTTALANDFAVEAGDLVVAVVSSFSAIASAAISDGLGNTYNALNTSSGLYAWYSLITNGGTVDINATYTSDADDTILNAMSFKGPFTDPALDVNPANNTDNSTPFNGPASGVLSQAAELIVTYNYFTLGDETENYSESSAYIPIMHGYGDVIAGSVSGWMAYQIVASTASVAAPSWTSTGAVSTSGHGVATFKQGVASAGQPYRKRLGGVKFTHSHGQW